MSLNPEVDQIVSLNQPTNGADAGVSVPLAMVAPSPAPPVFAVAPAYEPPAPPAAASWQSAPVAPEANWSPAPARKGRAWVVPAAIVVVGLIASGTLGYLLYTATGQRDTARHQLA